MSERKICETHRTGKERQQKVKRQNFFSSSFSFMCVCYAIFASEQTLNIELVER